MKTEVNFDKRHRLVREIIETIVLTVLMFVIINLAIQNYTVDGPSIEPSLHNQEYIMVDHVSYLFHAPARGDVIVFIAPPEATKNYVKRIIGVPGDVITIQNVVNAQGISTHVSVKVNGVTLNESSYVHPGFDGNPPGDPNTITRTVPADKYFVMGDDRRNSYDSRAWGLVPRANILGRAALVYWPLGQDNSGFLPNVSSTYANVHQPTTPKASIQNTTSIAGTTNLGTSAILLCFAPALLLLTTSLHKRRKKHLQHLSPGDL